jgi:cytosine/adenosine deaminase-related metal-dependent hydrolase
MPDSLLITHGNTFTLGQRNEQIPDGAIYVEGDTIVEVGPTASLMAKYPGAARLDAGGKIVLPASICGHPHFYGAFARGMAIPGAPATNFMEILERLWWKLDRALLWDDVRASALICLVDAIRHGCTTLIDHHASPNVIDGSLDIIADAIKETGLRASLCYEVTDRNGMDGARAGIAENVRFRRWKPAEMPSKGSAPDSTSTSPRTKPTRTKACASTAYAWWNGCRSSTSWDRVPSRCTASIWTTTRRPFCARQGRG